MFVARLSQSSPNMNRGSPVKRPLSRDNIKEETFDEEVDVEQCSDGEDAAGKTANGVVKEEANKSKEGAPNKKKKKEEKVRIMKPKCNCEELLSVDCFLETKELWDKFNELGTEMIITKTGR